MYALGLGTQENDKKAVALTLEARPHSDPITIIADTISYPFGGSGAIPRKYCSAADRWYERAALKGDDFASVRLGYAYAYGLGVPRNDEVAVKWLKKGTASGKFDLTSIMNFIANTYEKGDSQVAASKMEADAWHAMALASHK